MADDIMHPIVRWTSVEVAADLANGLKTGDLDIKIPAKGVIREIYAYAYDRQAGVADTTNLWVRKSIEALIKINDTSPTNFKYIPLHSISGEEEPQQVCIPVDTDDTVTVDFFNRRAAGAAVFCKLVFGMSDD